MDDMGGMLTGRFMRGLTASGQASGGSVEGGLHQVAGLAARSVPGCAGVALYARQEPEEFAATTHPDLATLLDLDLGCGDGPAAQALCQEGAVQVDDAISDPRWPRSCAEAVGYGIRAVLALAMTFSGRGNDAEHGVTTVCTLYGVRPRAFEEPEAATVAALLAEQATVVFTNEEVVTQAHEAAVHSHRALETRRDIEQAKGMLMHALGCGPDEAFRELQRTSQNANRKLRDVANWIIADHRERSG